MIIEIGKHEMQIDSDDAVLLEGLRLYVISSRNTKYAYFGKSGIVHRLILGVTDKTVVVDHINGNGLDNRRVNLRLVSIAQNVANRQRSSKPETGLPPGICRFRGKFRVQLCLNYKKHCFGVYADLGKAIEVLQDARRSLGRPPVSLA